MNHGEFRTPMFFTALGLTEPCEELKIALESSLFQKIGKNIISCAIFTASDAKFNYKMKALRKILRETGGVIVPMNLPLRTTIFKLAGKLTKFIRDPLFPLRVFPFLQTWISYMPFWKKTLLLEFSTLQNR